MRIPDRPVALSICSAPVYTNVEHEGEYIIPISMLNRVFDSSPVARCSSLGSTQFYLNNLFSLALAMLSPLFKTLFSMPLGRLFFATQNGELSLPSTLFVTLFLSTLFGTSFIP